MRRILFPLLIIGVTAGLFSLGSGAFYSDVETSIDNDIDTGTLDLTPDNSAAAICEITNFKPDVTPDNLSGPDPDSDVTFDGVAPYGDDDCAITVTNVGTIAGDLYLAIDFYDDLDNDCTEPELLIDTACTPSGPGELDNQLDVSVCTTVVANGTEDSDDPCTGTVKLADLAFGCTKVADLDPEYTPTSSGTYTLTVDLDSDVVDNASQGDSITFDLTFYLQQDGAPVPSHTPHGGSAALCGA